VDAADAQPAAPSEGAQDGLPVVSADIKQAYSLRE
jgi:hypothetical protein